MGKAAKIFVPLASSTGRALAAIAIATFVGGPQAGFAVASTLYGRAKRKDAEAQARRDFNRSQRDRTTMIRSAVEPRQIVLGRDRLSGPLIYVTSTGPKKEFLHLVVALGGHPFDAIETIYFNDDPLPTEDGDGFVTSGAYYKGGRPTDRLYRTTSAVTSFTLPEVPDSIVSITRSAEPFGASNRGSVTVPTSQYTRTGATITITSGGAGYFACNYRVTAGGKSLVRVKRYLGTQTAADPNLVAESGGEWTNAHIGRGVPYLYVRLEYDQDVFGSIGLPNISAVCRGAILFDPRRNRNAAQDLLGAAPGTPGTMPTATSLAAVTDGIARTVVGSGTDRETGWPYLDLRLQGTATGSAFSIYLPTDEEAATASTGQTWTARVTLRRISGTWAFTASSRLQLITLDGAGSPTEESFQALGTIGTSTSVVSTTTAIATASTAAVASRIRLFLTIGAAYDVTLRIMLPELFNGAIDSSQDPQLWRENSALATAWWLRNQQIGGQALWHEVPTAELEAEANICDESVSLVSGSQRRYTSNGTIYTDGALRDNLETLLAPMAGNAAWVQGRWLIRSGSYETPELTIDESYLARGDIDIVPAASRADMFNRVTGVYTDAAEGYIERQQPPVTNALYVAQDGGTVWSQDIDHAMVREGIRAQRLAKIRLEGIRQSFSVRLTCNLKAYRAVCGRTVYLTLPRYSIIDKPMLVTERTLIDGGRRVELSMIEVTANTFAWNFGNATTIDPAPNTNLPPRVTRPAAPTGVVATTTYLAGSTISTRVPYAKVRWNASNSADVITGGRVLLQHKRDDADDDEWLDAGVLPGDSTTTIVGPLDSGAVSIVRVAFLDNRGRISNWTPDVVGAQGITGNGPISDVSMQVYTLVIDPDNATAGVRYNRDGSISVRNTLSPSGYVTSSRRWTNQTGATVGDAYRIRFAQISGSAPTLGTLNSYQTLNADRPIQLSETASGATSSGTYSVAIEPLASPGDPDSTGVINLTAEVDSGAL